MSDEVPFPMDAHGNPLPLGELDAATVSKIRRSMRRKVIGAVLLAALSAGVSVMSCVGQSFSLRQAQALEGIQRELATINMRCK